jgi:hypothetical protein
MFVGHSCSSTPEHRWPARGTVGELPGDGRRVAGIDLHTVSVRAMDGLPDVPEDLPFIPGEQPSVGSIGRGSHVHDAGSVPIAAQEVIRNMRGCLDKHVPIDAAVSFLKDRRKGRALSLATFLARVVLPTRADRHHVSHADAVIAFFTGLNDFTIHDVARRVNKAHGVPNPMGGGGGRPIKRKFDSVCETSAHPPDEDDLFELVQDLIPDAALPPSIAGSHDSCMGKPGEMSVACGSLIYLDHHCSAA